MFKSSSFFRKLCDKIDKMFFCSRNFGMVIELSGFPRHFSIAWRKNSSVSTLASSVSLASPMWGERSARAEFFGPKAPSHTEQTPPEN